MVRGKGFTRVDGAAALAAFVAMTGELTEKSWAKSGMPMSSGRVAELVGAESFSYAVCDYSGQHAPDDRVYLWSICPSRKRHPAGLRFRGTRSQWIAGVCPVCMAQQSRQTPAPTFAQRFPDAVKYLADPADAESRAWQVDFACIDCGHRTPWSPRSTDPPRCAWCKATEGVPPGELVKRRGGGDPVKLEADLATAIAQLGVTVSGEDGIVTVPDTYVVPVITPDLVLPELRVVIELDNTKPTGWARNNHDTRDGIADDRRRDQLLRDLGWRVLRIRRPDQKTVGEWPWRIETTSRAPKKLARLILAELEQAGLAADSSHEPAGNAARPVPRPAISESS